MSDHETLVEAELAMRGRIMELELDYDAAHAVSSIFRAANSFKGHITKHVLRPAGLTWTGFVVLWVVWINEGMETRRAAESAAISKATLTGVVKTLASRGWIERHGREDDRRLVELHLTDSGKTLMEHVFPKFNAIESRVASGLSSKQKKDMTKGLRRIITTIENDLSTSD